MQKNQSQDRLNKRVIVKETLLRQKMMADDSLKLIEEERNGQSS